MGLFGKIMVPKNESGHIVYHLLRETNNFDSFLNYACAVHGILAFLLGLLLSPLILYYHSHQQRSVATVLFLGIASLDLVRSIYLPSLLVPKLLSSDLDPFWEANYTGWAGHVTSFVPLLTEVEFLLLVALCTVRYQGVRFPHKPLGPVASATVIIVILRIILYILGFVAKWLNRPFSKVRITQVTFTMDQNYNNRVAVVLAYCSDIAIGLILMYGIVISVLTVKYLNTLNKITVGSKTANARNRKSITIIVVMNAFSGVVALTTLAQAISLIIRSGEMFSTMDNLRTYAVIHGMPLSQSIFNSVSFVCVSSSFRKFVRRLRGKPAVSNSETGENSRRQSFAISRVASSRRNRCSVTV